MDSLVIYLIIGVVWIFQLLAKKREAEIEQRPARKEPESGVPSFPNVFVGNPDNPDIVPTQVGSHMLDSRLRGNDIMESVPELKKPSNDLTSDTLEQGIILSVILGPPRGRLATSPDISRHLPLLR